MGDTIATHGGAASGGGGPTSAGGAASGGPTRARLARLRPYRGDRRSAWLMLSPALAILVVLAIVPLVYLVYMALHRQNLFQNQPARYVGTDNFRYLFEDRAFRGAITKTLVLAVVTLTAEMILGFLAAALVFRARALPGMAFIRTALTTPILIAPIVGALMWRFMYEPNFGVINHLLTSLGLPAQGWLVEPSLALWSIAAIDVWQWTPFVFIVVLAGMYGLPRRIYEAAELDGTGALRQSLLITIPLLKRVLLVVLLLRAIDVLRMFDVIVATTQGGPGTETYTLPVYIWRQGFHTFEMGDAATASVVLLAIIAVVITLFVRVMAKQGAVGRTVGER
jgi:multiple sugar transport system permease protein